MEQTLISNYKFLTTAIVFQNFLFIFFLKDETDTYFIDCFLYSKHGVKIVY